MNSILVAALGVSGYEACKLGLSKGLKVTAVDLNQNPTLVSRSEELQQLGAIVFLGNEQSWSTEQYDRIVISPGIHPQSDFGKKLTALKVPIISELEFAASYCKTKLIGVTGTNGKTTTVELLTHCLRELGWKCIAAGNIGYALSRVAREDKGWDIIVVEVSSFQLEALEEISFEVGAILNVTSDHVDRYESFEHYAKTKAKILKYSKRTVVSKSVIGLNLFDCGGSRVISSVDKLSDFYRSEDNKVFVDEEVFDFLKHPLKGIHNAENVLASVAILMNLGFSAKQAYESGLGFMPAPHRLQRFLNSEQIIYINDSKATNPDAMRMAIESCGIASRKNVVLIAGGRDKKMDFNVVNPALCSYVRKLFIYGECRQILYDSWNKLVSCEISESFEDAVKLALEAVESDETLLLSPGCASLDSFKSYAERGEIFMEIVQEWTKYER
ncbi:MAG: UDP-N-acetylmuramoyl-L-alanine--D-glutamate ligase [Lentisphaeraceae bacterium]|nr:UDP-N-acetylmuramoyl-L-alanine--D-glutamate ligase [Lentisphaeraceae bacterium]